MYHGGIGGGGFILFRTPNGIFKSVDYRETAPDAANEIKDNGNENASLVGGLARYLIYNYFYRIQPADLSKWSAW